VSNESLRVTTSRGESEGAGPVPDQPLPYRDEGTRWERKGKRGEMRVVTLCLSRTVALLGRDTCFCANICTWVLTMRLSTPIALRPLLHSEFSLENEVFKWFLQAGNFELEPPPPWENSVILLRPLPDYVVCIMFALAC